MDPILLQKQLKDNANDLQEFCKDLKNWGDEMKRKDEGLKKPVVAENKPKKLKAKKNDVHSKPSSKIGATDYAKWDKFDPDAEEDDESEDDSELTDEHDESSRDEALVEKEKGNKFVKEQNWKEAIKCYTKAIDNYAYDPIFYANRALCYLRIGEMNKAESDCDMSLKLDKSYVKAYQRRAAAREALNKLYEAKQDLLKVLQLEPKNLESKKALDILRTKMGEYVKSPDIDEPRPISKFTASRTSTAVSTSPTTSLPQNKQPVDTSKDKQTKTEEDRIYIKAYKKPPHMRSKKPLKRIPVIEKDFITQPLVNKPLIEAVKTNVIERKEAPEVTHDTKPISMFKQKQKTRPIEEQPTTALPKPNQPSNIIQCDDFKVIERMPENPTKEEKNLCNDTRKMNEKTQSEKPHDVVLVAPKNWVQFTLTWNTINMTQKYEFLKMIDPPDLPKIFQEALESNYFSDILEVLVKYFVSHNDGVYEILRHLSDVKRFSMLTMFMTGSDKNNVRKLLDHISATEKKSKEEIDALAVKYEL